jgi:hypothetical protein
MLEVAHSKFAEIRWADNQGESYCPACGCLKVDAFSTRNAVEMRGLPVSVFSDGPDHLRRQEPADSSPISSPPPGSRSAPALRTGKTTPASAVSEMCRQGMFWKIYAIVQRSAGRCSTPRAILADAERHDLRRGRSEPCGSRMCCRVAIWRFPDLPAIPIFAERYRQKPEFRS